MALRRIPGPPRLSLLSDRDLARWHANVARGSLITADVYARRLAAFCEQMKVEPLPLAKLPEKALRDLILDFIAAEERKKRAGSYIQSSVKAVKSWLIHNGLKLALPLRIHGTADTPSLREERTPTQEELRTILLAATPRDRVSCAMMAFSGVRPEVLGNYRGNDGLRLGDFKDMAVMGKVVEGRGEVGPGVRSHPSEGDRGVTGQVVRDHDQCRRRNPELPPRGRVQVAALRAPGVLRHPAPPR